MHSELLCHLPVLYGQLCHTSTPGTLLGAEEHLEAVLDEHFQRAHLVFRINKRTICEAKHETSSVFKIGRSTPSRSASGSEWQLQIFTV